MTQTWWPWVLQSVGSGLADHLWQSTLCVALAAMLVRLAGVDRPSLRHGIWLAASVKFFVPFSLLVAMGERLAPLVAPLPVVSFSPAALQTIGAPFAVWAAADSTDLPAASTSPGVSWLVAIVAIWLIGTGTVLCTRWLRWRGARAVAVTAAIGTGREAAALDRVAGRWQLRRCLPIRETTGPFGPGLFGVWRPVLLWPAGLSARLTDEGIEAIVAHEVAHLRRGDNLAALVHTLVEAIFWFHPVVWWLGARLVDERERACDQEALAGGVPPAAFAESLLDVCRFTLASPGPLVASAAGTPLSQRVEAIMTYRARPSLSRGYRGVVATLAFVVLIGPVVIGMGRAQEAVALPPARAAHQDVLLPAPVEAGRGEAPQVAAPQGAPSVSAPPADQKPADPRDAVAEFRRGALPSDTPGLVRVTAIKRFHAGYTREAMKAKIQGTIEVEIVVGTDGGVDRARVVKGLDPGLDDQALKAALQWTFEPATLNGQPVAVLVLLVLDFRLY